jgi:hypothetical protein
MTGTETSKFSRSAAQYVVGVNGLALPDFARSRLGLDLARMGFVHLIRIAPPSMTGSIIGSAVLTIVAVACLNYIRMRSARMCGRMRLS